MTSMILPPTGSSIYTESDLEPQQVTVRTSNISRLALSTYDDEYIYPRTVIQDKTDVNLSTVTVSSSNPGILAQGIGRISVESIGLNYVSPNVNQYNCTFVVTSSVTGIESTIVIPIDYYKTELSVMETIRDAFNASAGLLMTFVVNQVDDGNEWVLTTTTPGAAFFIHTDCDAVRFGGPMYGINAQDIYGISVRFSVGLCYTRYIDFFSSTLTRYQKIITQDTNRKIDLVYRLYCGKQISPTEIVDKAKFLAGINFRNTDSLQTIDVQVRDMFGNFLATPQNAGGPNGRGGFGWIMNLLVEY